MSGDILVSARGLTRRYQANTAVADLDLELRAGEVLGLLGPNGAGKTTTLRMLAGCLAPTSGSVHVHGVDMALSPARAKAHLGYLPEQPPLYPELTVDEYLSFCARLHGVARRQRRQALESAKTDCGLTEVSRRPIGNLSKGYQQRVGIAQAILHRPDIVILDEPTVGLDPNQIREIRALIRRLGEQHSVILSSHILPEIQANCERVTIIHNGRLVYDRAIDDGSNQSRTVVAGFRNPPQQQILAALPGVLTAEPGDDRLWHLTCAPGTEVRDAVAEQAASQGWGLYELHAVHQTLEDTFTELTSGADAARKAA